MEILNIKFTDGLRKYKVLEYLEQFKMYRLKNYTDNRENELMKQEQIENYLNNAEYYNNRYNKSIEYKLKSEEKRQKEIEVKEKEEQEYNFCYSYTDTKTDLQKGKILKTLNQKVLFDNEFYTRKELIHKLINSNSRIEEYYNINRYSKKKIEGEYKKLDNKLEYRFYYSKEKAFLDITKTEYNYIKYLLDNNIVTN